MWPAKVPSTSHLYLPSVAPVKLTVVTDQSAIQNPASSIEALVRELTFIVAARKSGSLQSSVSLLDKYTADTVPTHLLQAKNGLVRRLGAVLLAFIFEHKSDTFRIVANDKKQPFCLSQSFLFLSKYRPAMKNFHPETLPHIVNPLLFYLPRAEFPGGLPGFMNLEKLYTILITKEYLRMPDPAQMVIWLQLEDFANQADSDAGSSHRRSRSSSSEDSPQRNRHNRFDSEESKLQLESQKSPEKSVQKSRASPSKRSPIKQTVEESDPSVGHRIKCFQFFKQVHPMSKAKRGSGIKGQNPATSPQLHNSRLFKFVEKADSRHASLWPGLKAKQDIDDHLLAAEPGDKTTPQPQTVRDWISKHDYSFYTSTIRIVSPQRRGRSFELALKQLQNGRSNLIFTLDKDMKVTDKESDLDSGPRFQDFTKTISVQKQPQPHDDHFDSIQEIEAVPSEAVSHHMSALKSRGSRDSESLPKKSTKVTADPKPVMFKFGPEEMRADTDDLSNKFTKSRESPTKHPASPAKSVKEKSKHVNSSFQVHTKSRYRRSTATSIDHALLEPGRKFTLQRAPVSLQDCEPLEKMKSVMSKKVSTIISTQASKDSFAKSLHVIPVKINENNSQDSEDILPISRLRNGNFFRIVYQDKDLKVQPNFLDTGKLKPVPTGASISAIIKSTKIQDDTQSTI